jgi:D-beta-D-heptose 7-phosphate kinase/D-beta-D-heptose 1-phosphate adenosyltransferase
MTLVFTNGCFDCLHHAHVAFLQDARALGDRLVVGLNSDESVRRLKGPSRPIFDVEARKLMLEAIRWVDEVVVFDTEEDLSNLVKELTPAVLVKGQEYEGRRVTGAEHARSVRFLPRRYEWSTTQTLERIRQ